MQRKQYETITTIEIPQLLLAEILAFSHPPIRTRNLTIRFTGAEMDITINQIYFQLFARALSLTNSFD